MKPAKRFDENGHLVTVHNILEDFFRRPQSKPKKKQENGRAPQRVPISIQERQQRGAETSRRLWADPLFRKRMRKLLSERAKANWRDATYRQRVMAAKARSEKD